MAKKQTIEDVIEEYVNNNDVEPIDVLKGMLTITANIVGGAIEESDEPVDFEFAGDDGSKCVISISVQSNETSA